MKEVSKEQVSSMRLAEIMAQEFLTTHSFVYSGGSYHFWLPDGDLKLSEEGGNYRLQFSPAKKLRASTYKMTGGNSLDTVYGSKKAFVKAVRIFLGN